MRSLGNATEVESSKGHMIQALNDRQMAPSIFINFNKASKNQKLTKFDL